MKKALCCALLTLALALVGPPLAQMARERRAERPAADGGTAPAQPQTYALEADDAGARDVLDVTLYFRYGGAPLLGAQRAQLDLRRDETVASVIVKLLIDGPDAAHAALGGLFPQGTTLISVSGESSTAFVTLSGEFLGRPDGAPAGWEDSAAWQEEAALRRRLAVQSVVLALTEDARYQRVQFFVADNDDDMPRRIPLCLLDAAQTDASLMLGACGRDETLLLTPQRVMRLALDAWTRKDWASLYALLYSPSGMPSFAAFEQEMTKLDVTLVRGEVSGGATGLSGRSATVVLDALIRSPLGGDALLERESVPLTRVRDNWAISLDTLRALMVRE